MSKFAGKTYWLVGASEGLGRILAKKLDAEGAHLILSARSADRLNSLRDDLTNAQVIAMDVTDGDAVSKAAKSMTALDGVIYNVGTYDPMPATEWDAQGALKMCDINFTGAMRVLGEAVPKLVKQGSGDITLIGSLAGYRGLPASVGYSASKAALISLAETMRFDLRDSGVVVRVVNPGFIKTRLTDKNSFKMPQLMEPEDAADRVLRAMRSNRFRTDFPAPFAWFIRLVDYLPDWIVYRGK